MANRYWRGGAGTWNSSNTSPWSATSGGPGGASVPTAADDVFFDNNSNIGTGAFTVTMANSPRVCRNITISGLDGTMTLSGTNIGLTVSGSLFFPTTNFNRTYTGLTTFNATTTGQTITTNGKSFGAVTFNGVGGGWTLGSAFSTAGSALTLIAGSLNTSLSSYSITGFNFAVSSTNAKSLTLNNSTVTFSSSSALIPAWGLSAANNLTINANTSTIVLSGIDTAVFDGGNNFAYNNVSFTSTSTSTVIAAQITGSCIFNNLTLATPTVLVIGAHNDIIIRDDIIINNSFTAAGSITGGVRRLFINSGTNGNTTTINCSNFVVSDADLRDINISGAAVPASGIRLGDCGGNSNVTFDAPKTVYWRSTGSSNWTSNSWSNTSVGPINVIHYPLPQDKAIIDDTVPALNGSISIVVGEAVSSIDATQRTNNMTISVGTATPTFYGNVALSPNVRFSSTAAFIFSNRTIKTIDIPETTVNNAITIDAPGGGIKLVNNNYSSTGITTLTQGTLDINDLTYTTRNFSGTSVQRETPSAINFGTIGKIIINSLFTTTWSTNSLYTSIIGNAVVDVERATTGNTTITSGVYPEANSISFNIKSGSYNLSLLASSNNTVKNIDFTGFTGTWNALSVNPIIYGNLTLSAGMTILPSGNPLIFGSTSETKNITTNGKTIDRPIRFDGLNGTWQLQDAMTLGSTRFLTFANGVVDLNGNTLTTNTANTAPGIKNITFNGGTLLLNGEGNSVWNNENPTDFTTTAGNGTGVISMTSANAKTFVGGNSTYNCNLNQGGSGNLTISGSNTLDDITNSVQPATILFTTGTTQTVNNFTLSGTIGNLIIIDSTTASQFTLSKASGTVSVSYLDIRNSNATGGASWQALTSNGNIDGGNNTGWIFNAFTPSTGNMFLLFDF